jgi:bifunctional DNA-binding transcriptional regulator/antitoxin component of YhaV-PrlF toxin-antitoxin module
MKSTRVRLKARGTIALPREIADKYCLEQGAEVSIVDLDGVVVVSPKRSIVPKLAAEIEQMRLEAGLTVEDLLEGLPRHAKARRMQRATR